MAMRDVERLQKEAEALSREEQIQLAEILLSNAKQPGKVTDLSSFSGCIKLTIDPIEYQRAMRSEWS
jgi:hypothetical protein